MKIIRIAKDSMEKLLLPIIILAICSLSFYSSALGSEIAEKEPNDEIPQANSIQLGTKIKGYFAQADDFDYFEFVVPEEGQILKIELSGPPRVDVYLHLYNKDEVMIQEINLLGEGEGESFIWASAPNGTYYLALEPIGEQANENEPYALTVVLFKEEARLVNPQALARAIEKGLSWLANG